MTALALVAAALLALALGKRLEDRATSHLHPQQARAPRR